MTQPHLSAQDTQGLGHEQDGRADVESLHDGGPLVQSAENSGGTVMREA